MDIVIFVTPPRKERERERERGGGGKGGRGDVRGVGVLCELRIRKKGQGRSTEFQNDF